MLNIFDLWKCKYALKCYRQIHFPLRALFLFKIPWDFLQYGRQRANFPRKKLAFLALKLYLPFWHFRVTKEKNTMCIDMSMPSATKSQVQIPRKDEQDSQQREKKNPNLVIFMKNNMSILFTERNQLLIACKSTSFLWSKC